MRSTCILLVHFKTQLGRFKLYIRGYRSIVLVVSLCQCFYPTALKGGRGIVFTHGVLMGRRAGGISETIRCKKLILGREIG